MHTVVAYLVASAALCWLQVLLASLIHSKGWTPQGMLVAFGNRDNLPDAEGFAGRAKRAGANFLESLPLLATVVLAASMGNADPAKVSLGIAVFFWARLVYWFVYLAGIPYLRTLVWGASIVGLGMIGAAALG